MRALVAFAPAQLPRLDAVQLLGLPVGIALAVTTGCVMLFGVLPAVVVASGTRVAPLRLDRRVRTTSRRAHRVRHALVSLQLALALVLLVAAGLVGRSLRRLETLPLGFDPLHLAIVSVAFDASKYGTPDANAQLLDAIQTHLRAVHGIVAVTPVVVPPFIGPNVWHPPSAAEGQTPAEIAANPSIPIEIASSQYFETFGTPIVRGRGFSLTDGANAPPVVVISQSVARRFWPGADPLGKRLRFLPTIVAPGLAPPQGVFGWRTVVGVVPDTRYRSLREAHPMIYLPWRQYDAWQGVIAVRTAGDAGSVAAAVRRSIRSIDPTLTPWQFQPLRELLGKPLAQPRLGTFLLAAFSAMALLLAALGLYGMMSFVVRERTREIGIRVALGATPAMIRRGVIQEAVAVYLAGSIVGLSVAFATTRLLTSILYDVSPVDPVTLVGVCVVLLAVTSGAAYVPARRATRVDPILALRAE